MELTFAPAGAPDIDIIYALSKALIDRYEDIGSIDYDKVLSWVRRKIEKKTSEYTCVFCGGKKAGYYRVTNTDGMTELDDLYILPEFRNRGIGTFIVNKCCTESKFPVMLYVFTRNTGAFALYERLGFRVTEQVGATRCIMVREPEDIL